MNFKEMSLQEIADFIKKEIPFDSMGKNIGIYETSSIEKLDNGDDITIGVSFEEHDYNGDEMETFYYFNVFIGEEYIDLTHAHVDYIEKEIPIELLNEIKSTICRFL